MSFRVHPQALDTFSQRLTDLSSDAERAKAYIETSRKEVDSSNGILFGLLYTLGVLSIAEAVVKNTERLHGLTSGSAAELHKSAEAYRHTEKKNARMMDAIYNTL